MVKRLGRNGLFYSCNFYPLCKSTRWRWEWRFRHTVDIAILT